MCVYVLYMDAAPGWRRRLDRMLASWQAELPKNTPEPAVRCISILVVFLFPAKLKESLLNQFLLCRNKTVDAAAIHDERNAPAARLLLSPKYSLAISSSMCWFGDTTGHWTECLCGEQQGSLGRLNPPNLHSLCANEDWIDLGC